MLVSTSKAVPSSVDLEGFCVLNGLWLQLPHPYSSTPLRNWDSRIPHMLFYHVSNVVLWLWSPCGVLKVNFDASDT